MKRSRSKNGARGGSSLPASFFSGEVLDVARGLLGKLLLVDGVGGPLVETEAYHPSEPASHSHRGPTPRNRSMFLRGGHVYVYRIHRSLCVNLVTGPPGEGAAVLLRALWPTHGLDRIAARRAPQPRRSWTDGPGKLCQALAITLADDGGRIGQRVRIVDAPPVPEAAVARGPRIGISKARELPWRFWVPDPAGLGGTALEP
ncbi:MAG: DNA-3-methyladenine glycosylase [Planctomycetota bacterium]